MSKQIYYPAGTKIAPISGTGNLDGFILGATNPQAATITTLNSQDVIIANGKAVKTDTTTAHTLLFQAYDVDDATYRTFLTLTNGNTPSITISAPSGGSGTIDNIQIGGVTPVSGAFTTISATGTVTITDVNIVLSATTGTKIGTATSQKLSFYNATPVVQQNTAGTSTGFTSGGGTTVTDSSTFTGGVGSTAYRISDIVLALKNLGLMAQ